jgi:hypothetical protein
MLSNVWPPEPDVLPRRVEGVVGPVDRDVEQDVARADRARPLVGRVGAGDRRLGAMTLSSRAAAPGEQRTLRTV